MAISITTGCYRRDIDAEVKQDRTMYDQSPYLINAGLQYQGDSASMFFTNMGSYDPVPGF